MLGCWIVEGYVKAVRTEVRERAQEGHTQGDTAAGEHLPPPPDPLRLGAWGLLKSEGQVGELKGNFQY